MLLIKNHTSKSLRNSIFCPEKSIFSLLTHHHPPYLHAQKSTYAKNKKKWDEDRYFDSMEHIHKSIELKPIISLKNCIIEDPNGCIPISEISKKGLEFDVPMKVERFLRKYPSIFEEFMGPEHNLPWFRLTPEAAALDKLERAVYEKWRSDLRLRLKKLVLMSREKVLPFNIIQEMQWYLGLPDDFLKHPDANLDGSFRIVELEDGLKGLSVGYEDKVLTVMQINAVKRGVWREGSVKGIKFPIFPSKGLGLRLRRKKDQLPGFQWFQTLPYVSPFEKFTNFNPYNLVSEKRVVGVLHELLSIFVEHAVDRKKLLSLNLGKYLGIPRKLDKVFERHPNMFYLSVRNNTCTAILKEAYCCETEKLSIKRHPLLKVRKKYINLIKKSEVILKNRMSENQSDFEEYDDQELPMCCLGLDYYNPDDYVCEGDRRHFFQSLEFCQGVSGNMFGLDL